MQSNHPRAAALAEPAPQTLKKYQLLGQLAKGGMAEVYLARADGLGGFERLFVLKRILPELAHDTEFVRMFLDEARTAATLHHSNIVQVLDVDLADGCVFYAMEHLHGHDLVTTQKQLAARGVRMSLDNAIAIVIAVAAGLHYAHERWGSDGKPLHIVHRDVAPNNVIVTYDGNVKLIDFGIAKAANNLSTTRFGMFKGKLPYASPEQCRCEPVDRRTDVFSLGVLLYELTTGEPLFTADNERDLMHIVTEAIVPRPRLRNKSYPRELEAIVLKALARDRDERYPTAQALHCDLEVVASKLQLDLSAMSLARMMEILFSSEFDQCRDAVRSGATLEQHIVTTTTARWAIARPGPVVERSQITDHNPIVLGDSAAMSAVVATAVPSEPEIAAPDEAEEISTITQLPGTPPSPTRFPETPPARLAAAVPAVQMEVVAERRIETAPILRQSPLLRNALIAAAAFGLVGLGALGSQWLASPSADTAPPAPVAAPMSATAPEIERAPAPPAAAPPVEPTATEAARARIERAAAAIAASTPPPTVPTPSAVAPAVDSPTVESPTDPIHEIEIEPTQAAASHPANRPAKRARSASTHAARAADHPAADRSTGDRPAGDRPATDHAAAPAEAEPASAPPAEPPAAAATSAPAARPTSAPRPSVPPTHKVPDEATLDRVTPR